LGDRAGKPESVRAAMVREVAAAIPATVIARSIKEKGKAADSAAALAVAGK
jgi:hypothetical protein